MELCLKKVCLLELCLSKVCRLELCIVQNEPREIALLQIKMGERGVAQVGAVLCLALDGFCGIATARDDAQRGIDIQPGTAEMF